MKKIINHCSFFLACYIGMCGLLFATQRNLLYYPQKTEQVPNGWNPIKIDNTYLGIEKNQNSKKIVVLFHGNTRNASGRIYFENFFPNLNIVIHEYPGFGFNSSEKINSENITKNAQLLLTTLLKNYSKDDILLVGESLGTGVASLMAKEYDINNLILITPYTSLRDVAQSRYWFAPAKYLLLDNFDSLKNLSNYKGNSLTIMSEKDTVIDVKFAKQLYNSLHGKKEAILVKNAGHSSWKDLMTQEQLSTLNNFIYNFIS